MTSYETLKETRDVILEHTDNNDTSPIAALIGTSDEQK